MRFAARSLSTRLVARAGAMAEVGVTARGIFDRALVLVTLDGRDAFAVVLGAIGNGPINVVIDAPSGVFRAVEVGARARIDPDRIEVGPISIDLSGAHPFDPRPDWSAIRAGFARDRVADILRDILRDRSARHRPAWMREAIGARIDEALGELRRWMDGDRGHDDHHDRAALERAARTLAGLGPGLTPGGDDLLAGAMLAAHLVHPRPSSFCDPLTAAAAPRTTALSAAFLRAARDGTCSAAWHHLLAALASTNRAPIDAAIDEVLAHGATSGADMLTGFAAIAA